MISVEEAQSRILGGLDKKSPIERVPLTEAHGRVLAEPLSTDGPMPPFTNTSMDGYAVQAHDTARAKPDRPVMLKVVGTIAAGHPVNDPLNPGECYKIMTGAPVPGSADAVVQVEWTSEDPANPHYVLIHKPVSPGQNLRYVGEDMEPGQVVLEAGTVLTPPEIGITATIGQTMVPVHQRPSVAIISTGDELIEPGRPLKPGMIRNSNVYALHASVVAAGGIPVILPHTGDRLDAIRETLHMASEKADILLSSGGVSVGDFDLVKQALLEQGRLDFWRVNMKPGKPVVYGRFREKPFFGLPGNPVSALVTFELFVRPFIRQWQGHQNWARLMMKIPLAVPFAERSDRRHYVRSRLILNNGEWSVWPHQNQGSAVQMSWRDADALMVVEENSGPYPEGSLMPCLLLNSR